MDHHVYIYVGFGEREVVFTGTWAACAGVAMRLGGHIGGGRR